ncbi:MAG: response regulator [Proteobacteria bacterium]|nr:MAG: response regulator [Pseudomonadota bacterium]
MFLHKISPVDSAALDDWLQSLPKRLSVLVVDDYEDDRELMKFFLKSRSIKVFEASSAEEAINMACAHSPDAIIMDIHMPGDDGIIATAQLKQMTSTRHIPILALSNDCDDFSLRENAFKAGCYDCLVKSATLLEVLLSIKKALT